jgi:hypothetical protein
MYKLELSYSERDFLFHIFSIKEDFSSEVYRPVYRVLADRMKQSLSDKSPVTMCLSAQDFEVLYATMYGVTGSIYSQGKFERIREETKKSLDDIHRFR